MSSSTQRADRKNGAKAATQKKKGEDQPDPRGEQVADPPQRTQEQSQPSETTALTKPAPTSVASYEGEETGFEGMDSSDFVIPYLSILSSGSPQVKKENPKYVQGAEAGMLMNSVTGELFDGKKGVVIIPVHTRHEEVEWAPRDQGGALIARHDRNDPLVKEARAKFPMGAAPFGDGNELIDTFYVFCVLLGDNGSRTPVVMSFKSTEIAEYRKWMSKAKGVQEPAEDDPERMVQIPLYAHKYRLTTVYKTKNNFDWHGSVIRFEGGSAKTARIPKDSGLAADVKDFRNQVTSGFVKTADNTVESEVETEADDL